MSELRPPQPPAVPNQHAPSHAVPIHPAPVGPSHPPVATHVTLHHSPKPIDDDPIELVDESQAEEAHKKIRAFGPDAMARNQNWTRKPNVNQTGSVRVRTFHGKLSDQGMEFLDFSINDWLDHHPEVEVKFVTSSVGVYEGKIREPALILNLWY